MGCTGFQVGPTFPIFPTFLICSYFSLLFHENALLSLLFHSKTSFTRKNPEFFLTISVTFPCGILGQVWYLIVSFPDLCILSYFKYITSPLTVTLLNWMRTVFCISVITLMSDLGSES